MFVSQIIEFGDEKGGEEVDSEDENEKVDLRQENLNGNNA